MFLFILFDSRHKTTGYFLKHKPATTDIILLYMYLAPSIAVQVLPIASLLASVIAMILLSRSNEITAMRAAGLGPLGIGVPIAIGAIFVSFLSSRLGEYVVPVTAGMMRYVEDVVIEKHTDSTAA